MSSSSSSATDVPDVEMDDPEIVIDSDIESSEDEAEEDYHGLAEEAAAEDLEPERQDLGPADGIVQVPVTRVSIEHLENNVNQKLEHQLEPFTTRNIKVDLGEQKYERNLDPPFRLGGACYIDFVFIKGRHTLARLERVCLSDSVLCCARCARLEHHICDRGRGERSRRFVICACSGDGQPQDEAWDPRL